MAVVLVLKPVSETGLLPRSTVLIVGGMRYLPDEDRLPRTVERTGSFRFEVTSPSLPVLPEVWLPTTKFPK